MDKATLENLQDFEASIENTLTTLHEMKKTNPSDVLIGYLLQHLAASEALLKTLLETEMKK